MVVKASNITEKSRFQAQEAMLSRKPLTLLLAVILSILISISTAISTHHVSGLTQDSDIYRLKLRVTTNSDWTRIEIEDVTTAFFFDEISAGMEAPQLRVHLESRLEIVKQQYDETLVEAEFAVYIANIETGTLLITITKGHLGYTQVEILNHNSEPAEFITILTHQGVANNPDNSKTFVLDGESIQERGSVDLPEKPNFGRKVLAFYYPWYGTPSGPSGRWVHWDPNNPRYASTNTPLAGYYDSKDEATILRHIAEAREAGLDAFISSWWGINTFEDQAFRIMLPIAEQEGFLITPYYEIAENREQIVRDLRYILNRYGESPAFLKVDGIPVVFVYVRVTQRFLADDWIYVFEQLRQSNLHCICIGDGFFEHVYKHFQGVHSYNEVFHPLDELEKFYKAQALKSRIAGKLFAATVSPGFDDSSISVRPSIRGREDGAYYRTAWDLATRSDPDWMLVTSFNEWHEGSEIEPSIEYGRLYLEYTHQYADDWR